MHTVKGHKGQPEPLPDATRTRLGMDVVHPAAYSSHASCVRHTNHTLAPPLMHCCRLSVRALRAPAPNFPASDLPLAVATRGCRDAEHFLDIEGLECFFPLHVERGRREIDVSGCRYSARDWAWASQGARGVREACLFVA